MPDPLKNAHYRYPDSEHRPLSGLHTGDEAEPVGGDFDVLHDQSEILHPDELAASRHEPVDGFSVNPISVYLVVFIIALVAILVLANSGILPLSGKVSQ